MRGHWILDSDPGEPWKYRCDQCGETTTDTCMGKPRANWCPLCGAYMREDGAGDKKQVEAAAPAEPEWIKGRLIDNLREWMCPKCGWNTFLPLGKPSYCEDCGWKPKQGDQ